MFWSVLFPDRIALTRSTVGEPSSTGPLTSVDISQRRLDVAAERAREVGLALTFLRADVTSIGVSRDETSLASASSAVTCSSR